MGENMSRLTLQGRVILYETTGETTDLTDSDYAGLESFADEGRIAVYILEECRSRLGLLKTAARGPEALR